MREINSAYEVEAGAMPQSKKKKKKKKKVDI